MTPLEKRQILQNAALRLARLLELNPPDSVITGEVDMMKKLWDTPPEDDTETNPRFKIV